MLSRARGASWRRGDGGVPPCLLSVGFREERGARVSERRRGAAYMEGKRRRGAELAVAEGAPLLCTFGVVLPEEDVTGTTGRAGRVGWAAVGGRWAVTACIPTGCVCFIFFFSFF